MVSRPNSPYLGGMWDRFMAGSNNPSATPPTPIATNAPFAAPPGSRMSQFFPTPPAPAGGNNPVLPSFADGGLVTSGPQPPAGQPQVGVSMPTAGGNLEAEIARFAQEHPDIVQHIQAAIAEVVESGELTAQELNTIVNLAQLAMRKPNMWPQLRQSVIQQGIATEQDVPAEFDPGLLAAVLIAGQAMQGQAAQSEEQPTQGGSKPIIAQVHEDEFVMPKKAVMFHGTDKLGKMIEKAHFPNGKPKEGKDAGK